MMPFLLSAYKYQYSNQTETSNPTTQATGLPLGLAALAKSMLDPIYMLRVHLTLCLAGYEVRHSGLKAVLTVKVTKKEQPCGADNLNE